MRGDIFALLAITIFITSCTTVRNSPPRVPTCTGQEFTISNAKGQKLFDVTAPTGIWQSFDWTKEKVANPEFYFQYKGQNQGMINAQIRIAYLDAVSPRRTTEEFKQKTTIAYLNKSMQNLLSKDNPNNLQDFYKPKNLTHGIKTIAGVHCRFFSIVNHSGPTLDTPTAEFRGMGSAEKQEDYYCPVLRDGVPWFLGIYINYSYSDIIRQKGLDIDFYETVKDFDAMLKPTLESLKLYGEVKQY